MLSFIAYYIRKVLDFVKSLKLASQVTNHKQPIATVDIMIFAESKILLIERGNDPYKGYWAFPGGRIDSTDDDILSAARRELKEETGLVDIPLEEFITVGNSKRDPRGFCISVVFVANLDEIPKNIMAGDDAVSFEWFSLDESSLSTGRPELPRMAFDHEQILRQYVVGKK